MSATPAFFRTIEIGPVDYTVWCHGREYGYQVGTFDGGALLQTGHHEAQTEAAAEYAAVSLLLVIGLSGIWQWHIDDLESVG